MTATIYTSNGLQMAEGKNLAIVYRMARKHGGVRRIVIQRMAGKPESAVVRIVFAHGTFAETSFADHVHAVNWANDRSMRRGSWWTGCAVEVQS